MLSKNAASGVTYVTIHASSLGFLLADYTTFRKPTKPFRTNLTKHYLAASKEQLPHFFLGWGKRLAGTSISCEGCVYLVIHSKTEGCF